MRMRFEGALLLAFALGLLACGGGGGGGPTLPPQQGRVMPDFALPDVNDTSATHGQDVMPSDYRGAVSAYYFAQGT